MPKQINLEFTRGDTIPVSFPLLDANGNVLELTNGEELYFTVKKTINDTNFLFQKKFSTGDIYYEDGLYKLTINSSDTSSLPYGIYAVDICYKYDNFVKTLALGEIEITDEVTFANNE